MKKNSHLHLARRERQIMESLYRREAATVADVLEDLPDPPSYSAVRAMLAKLEAKGHVEHSYDGPRYMYRPTLPRNTAGETALARLVETYFEGSAASTIAALLDRASADLGEGELERLSKLIEDARRRGQ